MARLPFPTLLNAFNHSPPQIINVRQQITTLAFSAGLCSNKILDFTLAGAIITTMITRQNEKFKFPWQISEELFLVEEGVSRSWGNLFLLLDSVERTKYWQNDAASFTRWIEQIAPKIHTKPAMLWRILSSGRFVIQVTNQLEERNIKVPSLEDMPDDVSPENVELLAKLERVAPEETFAEYAQKVFTGEAKRAELRSVWETYRPVLRGQTARGRGVTPPRINRKDPSQFRSVMEAATLEAFQSAGPHWTGISTHTLYKVFVHINPEGFPKNPGYLFAAVVVVKPKNGVLLYHGIRFRTLESPDTYKKPLEYCDHLWVFNHSVFHSSQIPAFDDLSGVPEGVGILEIKDNVLSVIKPACVIKGSGTKRVDLASALLVRTLGTK